MSILKANRSLDALIPDMESRVKKWLELCKVNNLNILITETKRSLVRQKFLFAFGRWGINKTGAKRTWTMKSNHLKGEAIDFAFQNDGKVSYTGNWNLAWDLASKVGLISLYRKYRVDKPHLELDPDWNPVKEKQISDQEKILEKYMSEAWTALDKANPVKASIAKLKGVAYHPYIIS